MRYDEEIGIRRPVLVTGVSSWWQVLAILSMLAAGALLVISVALGAVLAVEHRKGGTGRTPAMTSMPPGFPPGGPAADADEPPNPPYPLVADLRPAGRPVPPGEERPNAPRQTARDRFLALGKEVWTAPEEMFANELCVSPDGQSIAYLQGQALMVGPLAGEIQQVGSGSPAPPVRHRGPAVGRPPGPSDVRAVGMPVWSADGRLVYYADADGRLERYDVASHACQMLAFHGDSPVAVPGQPDKLIFRRSRAVPKADLPDGPPPVDPAEIVLGDQGTGETRVLVPESTERWTPQAVSPDGRRLALVSGPDRDAVQPGQRRLFLLDLAAGAAAKPRPVGAPRLGLGPVCWTADGQGLLYARQQRPVPPDCWEGDAANYWAGTDLFRLDLATGKETRLSRGGGFHTFSPTSGSDLFFLVWPNGQMREDARLWRVPLAAAHEFAAHEPDRPTRDQAAWTKLIDGVLKEAGVTADAGGEALTPDVLARLADGFARTYRERFQTDPPADADGWERQQHELQALSVPSSARARFAVVLGAAEGEYLRRRHGAVWHLGAGPLLPAGEPGPGPAEDESPFGLVMNPFQSARSQFLAVDDEEEDSVSALWLTNALVRAQGRPLVLANSPAAGKEGLQALADPGLTRASELFKQSKTDEAEGVLVQVVQQERNENNTYLLLAAGKLLHEQKRLKVLRKALERRVNGGPPEPRLYNLLGLALLETEPNRAAQQFQNALRCDLYYGPAYLNLAQAYEKAGNPVAAGQSLRRLLKLQPAGPLAADARQRLAALDAGPAAPAERHP
jgi:tetratricopeptide (TPR) repeat protein